MAPTTRPAHHQDYPTSGPLREQVFKGTLLGYAKTSKVRLGGSKQDGETRFGLPL